MPLADFSVCTSTILYAMERDRTFFRVYIFSIRILVYIIARFYLESFALYILLAKLSKIGFFTVVELYRYNMTITKEQSTLYAMLDIIFYLSRCLSLSVSLPCLFTTILNSHALMFTFKIKSLFFWFSHFG